MLYQLSLFPREHVVSSAPSPASCHEDQTNEWHPPLPILQFCFSPQIYLLGSLPSHVTLGPQRSSSWSGKLQGMTGTAPGHLCACVCTHT